MVEIKGDKFKHQDNKYVWAKKGDEEWEYMMVPRETIEAIEHELNGVEKLLEMVRKKSVKEVIKAAKGKTDEHGYTLKRSKYEDRYYHITKTTPYTLNMPLNVVSELVKRDLRDYYNYFPERRKYYDDYGIERYMGTTGLVSYLRTGSVSVNGLTDDKASREICREILGDIDRVVVGYEITGGNYGTGKYEVTYRATDPI